MQYIPAKCITTGHFAHLIVDPGVPVFTPITDMELIKVYPEIWYSKIFISIVPVSIVDSKYLAEPSLSSSSLFPLMMSFSNELLEDEYLIIKLFPFGYGMKYFIYIS